MSKRVKKDFKRNLGQGINKKLMTRVCETKYNF